MAAWGGFTKQLFGKEETPFGSQPAGEGVAFPASGGTHYLERERLGRSRTAARVAVGLQRVPILGM